MEPRIFATFDWAVPEEEIASTDVEAVPPGKEIMEGIRSALINRGFNVSALYQHDSYGWIGDVSVWSMIQLSDSWLIISDAPVSWLQKLRGRSNAPALSEMSKAIHGCLLEQPLARSIQWFSHKEFLDKKGIGGANEP